MLICHLFYTCHTVHTRVVPWPRFSIRPHPAIECAVVEQEMHIILLYADDIMLYLTIVVSLLPARCTLLDEYSSISGYKKNTHKSVIMPLNSAAQVFGTGDLVFGASVKIGLELCVSLGLGCGGCLCPLPLLVHAVLGKGQGQG